MNTHQFFDQFLNFQRIERGLSKNSLSAYTRDLERFNVFLLREDISVLKFNEGHTEELVSYLNAEKLALSTTNRILSTLRSFYSYLEREHGAYNPMKDVLSRKIPVRLPKALTISQVAQLIEATVVSDDIVSLRNKAILELLYSSGARVSEVIGLNLVDVSDVKSEDSTIRIIKLRGKGGK
jgi:integrase/recombinase XerD